MTYDEVYEAIVRLADDLRRRSVPKLPPERDLAERLNTSRTTVRRALASLEAQSVIRRVKGRSGGAYLDGVDDAGSGPDTEVDEAVRKVRRSLNQIVGVPEMLRTQGFTTGTRVIAATKEVPPAAVAEFLSLPEGALAASVVRVRFADGDSLSLERLYTDAGRFPSLFEHHLSGSMYSLFESRFGVTVGELEEEIEASVASFATATMLGVEPGTALIKLTRRAVDQDGRPFEYSVDLFRSDRTRLIVSTTNASHRVRSERTDSAMTR
jgi:GntR family transcriptional regulator